MRTTRKQRNENALKFYRSFMSSDCTKAAIVVERVESSNPHISRCRFWAVPSSLAYMQKPVVIADSTFGIEGCFMEFLCAINDCPQTAFHSSEFKKWLIKTYKLKITYEDGLVFMLERV